MKDLALSMILYIFCAICVAIYTILIYLVGYNFWPEKTKGSLILDENGAIRGSYLIAQHFTSERYFKSRPGFIPNQTCEFALYNEKLQEILISNYDAQSSTPHDIIMMSQSASSYDPYITTREARIQAQSIARARGYDVNDVYKLVDDLSLGAQPPFFELDIVNVMLLNTKLDSKIQEY